MANGRVTGLTSTKNAAQCWMMSDSIEYKTLVRCRNKLVTAFKLDPVTIANNLVAKNLIPPAVASEVTELSTKEQKAGVLVECVFGKVEISQRQYDCFIAVFSEYGWLGDLVDVLNRTHRKFMP